MQPRRPGSSSSTTERKVANYDEELQRPTTEEGPGQGPSDLRGIFSANASSENETKRAMQGRHLMMIGECLFASASLLAILNTACVSSHRWNDRDGYLFECWVGKQGCPWFCLYVHVSVHHTSRPKAVALAGPGSALLSYVVIGVFVYAVVITL